jgi:L-threonylcarbamoyladenylate synthase
MRAVLKKCGLPLAAPSANPFGYISPTLAEHVRASLGARAPWILDGGACIVGVESTIVDVSDPTVPPRILRPGPITAEALAQILGQPIGLPPEAASPPEKPAENAGMLAPGLLPRHYSPHTPLEILPPGGRPPAQGRGARGAWIRLNRAADNASPRGVDSFWLSEKGNLSEAAHALYALLRQLDSEGYQRIWCETAPHHGFGVALNDRLQRAAGRVAIAAKK